MLSTVLIANRGEIALRVARTCRELGIRSVVAHSTADQDSAPVRYADEAIQIGPAPPRHSYLDAGAIISAAEQCGADAIHPGYGFLSEDPDFAEICESHGLGFVGPSPDAIELLGNKLPARRFAADSGIPVLPGSDDVLDDGASAKETADKIGYPVVIKAAAGGGGRGMSVVREPRDFLRAYAETRRIAQTLFGNAGVYVEKYLETARHVEIQILADHDGNVVHLGARDCSVQRRRQKLIEETPPPSLPPDLVDRMGAAAARCAAAAGYVGAATFEFVVDEDNNFYFIEVNTRIQVEHPVTEMATGIDLVREQLLVAGGCRLSVAGVTPPVRGVAIECRVNAEDPNRDFMPTPGVLDRFSTPDGPFVRVDTHARPGMRITADYDSLLAKVLTWAPDRDQAIARMDRALQEIDASGGGVSTTTPFLLEVLAHPLFRDAKHTTGLVDHMIASQLEVA